MAEKTTFNTMRVLLQLEGLIILIVAVALYAHTNGNGWAFLALLLLPDITMIGYLRDPKIGAAIYNIGHALILPLMLGALALVAGWMVGVHIALIWIAHIGMDRAVGYGLKYTSDFKSTHMQRI